MTQPQYLAKPFRRIIRPFSESGEYRPPGRPPGQDDYFEHPEYAPDRVSLVRAYKVIEGDLVRLLEFVEPADANLKTYSHRLYELLLRASTEFEANCKGILKANDYQKCGNWTMDDYSKVDVSSRLSDYHLRIPIWRDGCRVLKPFEGWTTGKSLVWYQDYNEVKHNRSACFDLATLENVLLAVSAVLAVLFSQFYLLCFRAHVSEGIYETDNGWFSHTDSIFGVKPSSNWPPHECYGFNWSDLCQQPVRFASYPFR